MADAPKNIKVSIEANEIMADLENEGYFENSIAAYRMAIAVAIVEKLSVEPEIKTTENKWDTASVFNDKSTNIENMITLLKPEVDQPVLQGIQLAEHGLRWLEGKRKRNEDLWAYFAGLTS